MHTYNNHHNLINYIKYSTANHITEIIFSLDFMDISSTIKTNPKLFLKELEKQFTLTSSKKEAHCKNPIWQDLFQYRSYFDLGDGNQAWVLHGKVRPLTHIDILIRLPHPSPSIVTCFETALNKMESINDYWVSKLEPTFDMIIDRDEYRL